MSLDALKGIIDTVALRHDRNADRFGLMPWTMLALVGITSYGWLSATPQSGDKPYVLPLAVLGCAAPIVLFFLMGPIDMLQRCTQATSWWRRGLLFIGYGLFLLVAVVAATLPFELPFRVPVPQFVTVHDRFSGFFVDMSSTQLQVGVVWVVTLVWFMSQLLALRGSSLRSPELATTYKGVDWTVVLLVWLAANAFRLPGKVKSAAGRVKDAPNNFKGARDAAPPLSEAHEVVATRYEVDEEGLTAAVPTARVTPPVVVPSVVQHSVIRPVQVARPMPQPVPSGMGDPITPWD